jgi:hypothetical protein
VSVRLDVSLKMYINCVKYEKIKYALEEAMEALRGE